MAHEDLRALIASLQESQRRDREVYDRRLAELATAADVAREKYEKLVRRVMIGFGGFAMFVWILNWIGPTIARKAIGVLIGIP